MKNNNSLLSMNPFNKIAGIQALVIGLIIFAISIFIAHLGGVFFLRST